MISYGYVLTAQSKPQQGFHLPFARLSGSPRCVLSIDSSQRMSKERLVAFQKSQDSVDPAFHENRIVLTLMNQTHML